MTGSAPMETPVDPRGRGRVRVSLNDRKPRLRRRLLAILALHVVGITLTLAWGYLGAWRTWHTFEAGPASSSPWILAPRDAAQADGVPIDVDAENAAAIARIRAASILVVVPGFTPNGATAPVRLDPIAEGRLARAVEAWRTHSASTILVSGGNVHPEGTPYNEAWEMRRHLVEVLSVPADAVVLEPYARHSTTNLRNAGRFMRAHGVAEAIVVTDPGQGLYFGLPGITSFSFRCERELGYLVGPLLPAPALGQIRFRPAPEVERRGNDPLDP